LGLKSSPPRAVPRFTVTEVRNALRCPRVFALGRSLGQAVAFPVGASSLGALFHRIAERFARELANPPEPMRALLPNTSVDCITDVLSSWILGYLKQELAEHPSASSMPAEIDDLAEALRELANYLAKQVVLDPRRPSEALRVLVQQAEFTIDAVLDAGGGIPVQVSGRVDAIYCRAAGAVDVVEYKLTDDANRELDEAQVAIYRHLLRKMLETDVDPVILRFRPGLAETKLSPLLADGIMVQKILPLLGKMVQWSDRPETTPATTRRDLCITCPMRRACAETYRDVLPPRDQPPAGAAQPIPDPRGRLTMAPPREPVNGTDIDDAGQLEAQTLAKQILAQLKKENIVCSLGEVTVGARLVRVEMQSSRQRVVQLDKAASDVEHKLVKLDVHYMRDGARRFFWAPRRKARLVHLESLLAKSATYLAERPGRFVLGEALDGSVIVGDFADGSTCHLLVGGQSGSGKSVLLQALIVGMCHFHSPAAIQFSLVDPKRVTFGAIATMISAHLAGPVLHDTEGFLTELEALGTEMEERYTLFQEHSVENIDDYNVRGRVPLPRRIVVVDEFQDLLDSKTTKQSVIDGVKRLGSKARAAGIHLVLATQRPDARSVPGEIKNNLAGRIALRVSEAVNSRIILDQNGAEELLDKGDFLANLGHGIVRGQAAMVGG
jgi:S-DNA-T family DNA segregation ATPase FtsK/SpoIIIE